MTDTGDSQTTTAGGGVGGAVSSTVGAPTTQEPPATTTPPVVPPITPTTPATTPSTPDPAAESEDEGDDFQMDRRAFNKRVGQAKRAAAEKAEATRKAWLKERYGTDDEEEVDRMIAEASQLREAAEEKKRAEMTELERVRADLAAEQRRRQAAEQRALTVERHRRYDRQDAKVVQIAGRHVDPDLTEDAALLFARHLRTLSKDDVKKMSEKDVEGWFRDLVKRKPAWAPTPADAGGEPPEKPRPRQPVTTGAPPTGQPQPTSAAMGEKTPRPGQPNTMTRAEFEAYKRKHGYSY